MKFYSKFITFHWWKCAWNVVCKMSTIFFCLDDLSPNTNVTRSHVSSVPIQLGYWSSRCGQHNADWTNVGGWYAKLKYTWYHDDVIKWKHFSRYWPFVRGIHRSPVNSPHKGQWRGALMFSLICAWINGSVNNREAGNLRSHHAHHDVTVMKPRVFIK